MDVREATTADPPTVVTMKAAMFEEGGRGHLLSSSFVEAVRSDYERLIRTVRFRFG